MPKPVFKNNDLIKILEENILLLEKIDQSIKIVFIKKNDKIFFKSDKEQISRAFFNLVKNSIESIQQKSEKTTNFEKKISIEISQNNDHINLTIIDSGIGFDQIKNNIKDILNPYFTTKKKGTGLGLSIVNKIISDHNGELKFNSINDGAKIEINFTSNGN
jgi:two-component system nitrogen regulation sensor histidine kinase NtrY